MAIYFGDYLHVLLKLVVALLIGGLIGYEREKTRHIAGLRTHVLVSITAAALMSVASDQFGLDAVSRIGQAIMTGIGFLGAGTIISKEFKVKGLTTAASIWAVAGLGVIVGLGAYFEAVVSAILIFVVLKLGIYGTNHKQKTSP